jgi:hypothetical protein
MKRHRAVLMAGLVTAWTALVGGQAALQPLDFAQGASIDPPSGQAFFRINVPDHVFTETAWPDMRDLAVFNGAGELVSFARVTPPSAEGAADRVALRTFRLESTLQSPQVEVDARVRGVELRLSSNTSRTGVEYLLTVADEDLDRPIERLILDWQDRGTNWRQTVTVAVSADLVAWRSVAFDRPILDLRTDDGQRLRHREVGISPVTPRAERYWKVTFGPGIAPRLTSVEGVTTAAIAPPPPIRLPTVTRSEADGNAVYELPVPQPVDRIRITPQIQNSVLPLIVEGRETAEAPWQPITRAVAYGIVNQGADRVSEPVAVGGRLLKSIRLRPLGASWGATPPVVEVEREPLTLVVNSRGAGPFLLAWGSRVAEDTAVSFNTLVPQAPADGAVGIPEALLGSRRTLGGPRRLTETTPAERAAAWQTTLVWAMLVGGVGALGLLAFRVWRQSQDGGPTAV